MTLTLYSQYFNPKISKTKGRRVPLETARKFSDSRLEEILRSLKFQFESREAHYPRIPWEPSKMYVIEANVKKSTLIELISRRL
ncbi:MAG: signal recognition particle [Candidatus Thermoplasmatota archaeon]|jgi:signal recognition particle subunit SRP19|nr:signal recognition particle [Candidatus Thermoplasmatota archaeon]MCL5955134.1 signal recognition particle [Candidatus Thermoplasmatota archaeon]